MYTTYTTPIFLSMKGMKMLRDRPLTKAALFCCVFVKFLTYPQKLTTNCCTCFLYGFLETAFLPRYLVLYRCVQPGHERAVQAGRAGPAAARPGLAQCIHYIRRLAGVKTGCFKQNSEKILFFKFSWLRIHRR